jgi:hypothetical protein
MCESKEQARAIETNIINKIGTLVDASGPLTNVSRNNLKGSNTGNYSSFSIIAWNTVFYDPIANTDFTIPHGENITTHFLSRGVLNTSIGKLHLMLQDKQLHINGFCKKENKDIVHKTYKIYDPNTNEFFSVRYNMDSFRSIEYTRGMRDGAIGHLITKYALSSYGFCLQENYNSVYPNQSYAIYNSELAKTYTDTVPQLKKLVKTLYPNISQTSINELFHEDNKNFTGRYGSLYLIYDKRTIEDLLGESLIILNVDTGHKIHTNEFYARRDFILKYPELYKSSNFSNMINRNNKRFTGRYKQFRVVY